MPKAPCVKVPSSKAEEERRRLSSIGALDAGLKLKRDGDFVLIPLASKVDSKFEVCESEFLAGETRKTYQEIAQVPEEMRGNLPTSFDIIGDIAIVKLKDDYLQYKGEIGEAILKTNKNIKTVCLDKGVSGEFRVRSLEVIAGENRTETIHVEYGCRIKVDVAKVYFSPRLANERMEVAKTVKPGETIIDMFAGAGPFSIMIAKYAKPSKIYAIDLNPTAVEYAENNVKLNKAEKIVGPICADARTAVKKLPKADRILMNLPHSAHEFFADALGALKESGTINYYEISEEDGIGKRVDALEKEAMALGFDVKAKTVRIVHQYSPTQVYFSVEFSASATKFKTV